MSLAKFGYEVFPTFSSRKDPWPAGATKSWWITNCERVASHRARAFEPLNVIVGRRTMWTPSSRKRVVGKSGKLVWCLLMNKSASQALAIPLSNEISAACCQQKRPLLGGICRLWRRLKYDKGGILKRFRPGRSSSCYPETRTPCQADYRPRLWWQSSRFVSSKYTKNIDNNIQLII